MVALREEHPARARTVRSRTARHRGGTLPAGTPGLLDLTDMALIDVGWTGVVGVGVLDSARCGVTIDNIGVELRYTGDLDNNSVAVLEYKKSTDSLWRTTLPMWRSDDIPTDKYHAGSALLCDANTLYDLRVTVTDSGQTAQVTAQVRTRANPPDPATLTINRWLDNATASVNDAGTGTAVGVPVKSLRRALTLANSASGDQTWLLKDGYYVAPGAVLTGNGHKITFVGEHPASDLQAVTRGGTTRSYAQILGGGHATIEPRASDGGACMWAPTGATDPDLQMGAWTDTGTITHNRIAPWVSTVMNDSNGISRTVWVWTGCPINGTLPPGYMTFCSTRSGRTSICPYWLPQGVVAWPNPGTAYTQGSTNTAAEWLAEIYDGSGYHFGFWSTATTNIIYARFPDDINPNSMYGWVTPDYSLTAGQVDAKCFDLATPDHRFSGLEFRGFANAFQVHAGADRTIVDRCYFEGCKSGYYNRGTMVTPTSSLYSNDTTFERNYLQNHGFWELTAPTPATPMPWRFIKQSHKNEAGTYGGDGMGRRNVVRNCTSRGGFDFVGYFDTGYDRYSGENHDLLNNWISECGDDAFDLSYQKNNVRIMGNRIEYTYTALSSAPTQSGVVYVINNVWWRTGAQGVRWDYLGSTTNGLLFKTSGVTPPSKIYVIHNTLWSDALTTTDGAAAHCAGWTRAGGGLADLVPHFVFRNNIIRASPTAGTSKQLGTVTPPDASGDKLWDSDYNDWSAAAVTGTSDRYMSVPVVSPGDSTASYRTNGAAYGVGAHDCLRSATFSGVPDAQLVDPVNGDLHLIGGSSLLAAGIAIYPYERVGVDFPGIAPNIGAIVP